MKKLGIVLILSALMIAGCTSSPSKKKRSSNIEQTSEISSETGSSNPQTSSQPAPSSINTSNPTSSASNVSSVVPSRTQ